MTPGNNLAVAFRSTAISPKTMIELAKKLDDASSLSHIFIPEGSSGGFRSLDICSACLAVSTRLYVGSGVIRILEHDPAVLASRILTLQQLSGNRFCLGVGTGPAGNDPKEVIRSMLKRLQTTRERYQKFSDGKHKVAFPETFIAALRPGIAKQVAPRTDGLLLNLCPPEHASKIINSLGNARQDLIVSCYLKIYYAKEQSRAETMMIEEFASYNRNPSYHGMFESAGVAKDIESANSAVASNNPPRITEKMLKISLANPAREELSSYVASFREAGVDLPCLYPYFEPLEGDAFKIGKFMEMVQF